MTHPAAAQPTAIGRTLWPLHLHDGRLYPGYGDWGVNTGPTIIASAAPDDLTTWTEHLSFDSEAISLLRSIDDVLYVPATDPLGAFSDDYATNQSGTWVAHRRVVDATHVFDIARLGDDLFLVGSQGSDAVVWRHNGTDWTVIRRSAPTTGFNRYYFSFVLDGKLWVQLVRFPDGPASTSRCWDGTKWTTGPSVLGNQGLGWKPLAWNGGIVLHRHGLAALGPVGFFDGTSTVWSPRSCYDFTIDDTWGVVTVEDGQVVHSVDFDTWEQIATCPTDARSIAVIGDSAYLGTVDSEVITVALAAPVEPPAPEEPDEPPDPPHSEEPADPEPLPTPEPPVTVASGAHAPTAGTRMLIGA